MISEQGRGQGAGAMPPGRVSPKFQSGRVRAHERAVIQQGSRAKADVERCATCRPEKWQAVEGCWLTLDGGLRRSSLTLTHDALTRKFPVKPFQGCALHCPLSNLQQPWKSVRFAGPCSLVCFHAGNSIPTRPETFGGMCLSLTQILTQGHGSCHLLWRTSQPT